MFTAGAILNMPCHVCLLKEAMVDVPALMVNFYILLHKKLNPIIKLQDIIRDKFWQDNKLLVPGKRYI